MKETNKNLNPRFKIGDIVKTNEHYHKVGRQLFGKELRIIRKGAPITSIRAIKGEDNPIHYEIKHHTCNLINEIFLEKMED